MQRDEPNQVDPYVMSGSAISNAANRISYVFDLHGPSFAVDTACSSSLVAVHEACVSLWRGESSLAIAAGVNALLSPSAGIGFSKARMLSPTGRCRPFDAAGDGYVRSEGGAVVILQPLAQALAENNPVHAVIVGSGVNSDGRTKGLAMPNQAAQEALLRRVYRDAGIDPGEITYIEAHGTGTSVGDPIECAALGNVLGVSRAPGDRCRIGSVKSNIGHLEPASGIAGLLKVVLALRHRAIPRTLHFTNPNPQIPFEELNLSVVSEYTELPPGRLTMGVNSFGFGGTNAHVVLRNPEPLASTAAHRGRRQKTGRSGRCWSRRMMRRPSRAWRCATPNCCDRRRRLPYRLCVAAPPPDGPITSIGSPPLAGPTKSSPPGSRRMPPAIRPRSSPKGMLSRRRLDWRWCFRETARNGAAWGGTCSPIRSLPRVSSGSMPHSARSSDGR